MQHPSKYLVTRERIDEELERLDWSVRHEKPRAFSLPYSPNLVEGKFSEVRGYGVLRSSLPLAPPNNGKRYAIWGMHNTHPESIMLRDDEG